MASDSHAKRPIVVERRKEKGRKKTPRLTKTYDVKIIPATVGVVAETEEPPKKRVAAYCRVSTDQEAQETSLEEQMAHFNTVIAEHPDWELAGIYADEGISGTQVKHRVQFQQMIEDAKAKKIDLILTKSISRFARNVVDCLTNIRLLRNLRPPVSVYFDKERLDSLDEKAEVFLTMLASFAQEESRSISTNIKWATRSRMKAGTQKISTTSLLGYDTDDDGAVTLEGEAYFHVTASKEHPFIVKTKDMDVMVTGTEFNVKAYSDEMNVQTTLLQGVVTVFSGFEKKEKMEIKPNQQAEWCRRSVKMRVREVDPDLFMAWKNGRFIFRQDRLEDIMRTLARWYGVEVVYLDESVKSMLFAGKLDRSEEITPILDVLRTTDKLSVDVKGKKIVIGLK